MRAHRPPWAAHRTVYVRVIASSELAYRTTCRARGRVFVCVNCIDTCANSLPNAPIGSRTELTDNAGIYGKLMKLFGSANLRQQLISCSKDQTSPTQLGWTRE